MVISPAAVTYTMLPHPLTGTHTSTGSRSRAHKLCCHSTQNLIIQRYCSWPTQPPLSFFLALPLSVPFTNTKLFHIEKQMTLFAFAWVFALRCLLSCPATPHCGNMPRPGITWKVKWKTTALGEFAFGWELRSRLRHRFSVSRLGDSAPWLEKCSWMNEIAAQFKNFRIKRQQQKNMLDRKNSNNKKSKNGQAKIMRHHQSPETSDAQVGIPFAFCLYTYISTIYRQIYVRYFSVYISRCLLSIFFFSCCIWRSLVERWKCSADVFSISLYLYWQARKFSNFARRKLPHT